MKLQFLYHPVPNAVDAARFYREQFGWTELWREKDMTIGMKMPGTDVVLMLDQDDGELTAGGIFEVPSVDDFYREKKHVLQFEGAPTDIPGGRYAQFRDPAGNVVRILDSTKEQ
ncbi:VOC family protein [Sulfobacillus harzensis]|uniref:VOC family protein n=1 Tax=Sulfobacillus harzensis TaxID=2729629 RepID=A0A7Y0Q577_9FIRM|nr:VOC family protein [Sulfobacillus harzensis]NMP24796.1 VOC family protein [Sulfobacillus harzensis]